MAKKNIRRNVKHVPPQPARPLTKKCIFCDGPGLSRTHIWPDWLNKLLKPGPLRQELIKKPVHTPGASTSHIFRAQIRQGSIFTQKPYLACMSCNNGWMNGFEVEMGKFSIPLFMSLDTIALDEYQSGILPRGRHLLPF